MGKLILVPTPIGNLEDITFRALRVLKEAEFILCEDTRHTGKLLAHFQIKNKLQSFHAHNEHKIMERITDRIKSSVLDVALVSDAGTPGISDPGFLLVRECVEQDIEVECLPGATAIIPALVVSGFPINSFSFYGFPPPKKGRETFFKNISEDKKTLIFYESPHKLMRSLNSISEVFGNETMISVSREISKKFEEIIRGTAEYCVTHFEKHPPKGEFAIVINQRT